MGSEQQPEPYVYTVVRHLRERGEESEIVEFKENRAEPDEIGEYISALSNSAALKHKPHGYLIWGVADVTRDIVGTTFDLRSAKVGQEQLENWLLRLLTPQVSFRFLEHEMEGKRVVVLQVTPASHIPVQFKGQEYVRVGSYKKKLKDHPELQRELWRILDRVGFEGGLALERLSGDAVLRLLDYPAYFDTLDLPLPENSLLGCAGRLIGGAHLIGWATKPTHC